MKNSEKREKKLKLLPIHFYREGDKIIFTETYHIDRGYCCGNICRHCPYYPKHIKNNKTLSKN